MTVVQNSVEERIPLDFPSALVESRGEEEALLTMGACREAIGAMHRVIGLVFEGDCISSGEDMLLTGLGIYKSIEEYAVVVKNTERLVRIDHAWGNMGRPCLDYLVLRVVLKCGQVYAVDLTGAQFGWPDVVVPWEKYRSQHIRSVTQVFEFENNTSPLHSGCVEANFSWTNAMAVGKEVKRVLEEWLATHETSLAKILKLKQEAYLEKIEALKKALSDGTAEYIKTAIKTKDLFVRVKSW